MDENPKSKKLEKVVKVGEGIGPLSLKKVLKSCISTPLDEMFTKRSLKLFILEKNKEWQGFSFHCGIYGFLHKVWCDYATLVFRK